MASSKEYLNFILEQMSGLNEVSSKAMVGEYTMGKLLAEYMTIDFLSSRLKPH